MKNRKVNRSLRLLLIGALLFSLSLAAGCGQRQEPAPENGEAITGSITVAGSTSVQPIVDVLAEEFMAQYPGTRIDVQGGGSSQGIETTISGAAQVGMSSRELKPEEQTQLTEYTLALDGIAIVVHPSNVVENLSMDQVREIYLGNITNWSEVGGSNAMIAVVSREAGSGTRGAFEDILMDKQDIYAGVIIQNSTGAIRQTVAGDRNAIGYISFVTLSEEVKALSVGDTEATIENVQSGAYKVARPFLLLTKGEPTGLTKTFLDYVLGPLGQAIVVEEGAISLTY